MIAVPASAPFPVARHLHDRDNESQFRDAVRQQVDSLSAAMRAATTDPMLLTLDIINKTGSDIAADKLVAVTGYDTTTGRPKIVLADADVAGHDNVWVTQAVVNNGQITVAKSALSAANLDTSAVASAGDPVFLSTTAGGFTVTAPTAGNARVIPVGFVVTKDATVGQIKWLIGPVRKAASSDSNAVPLVLFDHYADANNGTTVETDLYSDTLAAGQLAANGEKISAQYGGLFVGDATSTQRLKAYFGGSLIFDTGALGLGVATDFWDLWVTVVRESSSVVRCSVAITTNASVLTASATYTRITGLTLTNTQVLKITGTAAGVSGGSNQITAKEGYVQWLPAAA